MTHDEHLDPHWPPDLQSVISRRYLTVRYHPMTLRSPRNADRRRVGGPEKTGKCGVKCRRKADVSGPGAMILFFRNRIRAERKRPAGYFPAEESQDPHTEGGGPGRCGRAPGTMPVSLRAG
jgi:hypothetical protein